MINEEMYNELFSVEEISEEEKLKKASPMVHAMKKLGEGICEDFKTLKNKIRTYRSLEEDKLPNFFAEMGLNGFTLNTGEKVVLETGYYPNIKKDDKEEVYDWLLANKHNIVKNTVTINLNTAETEQLKKLQQLLDDNGFSYKVARSVHDSTLKSFVKEYIEENPDDETFQKKLNVYKKQQVVIKGLKRAKEEVKF